MITGTVRASAIKHAKLPIKKVENPQTFYVWQAQDSGHHVIPANYKDSSSAVDPDPYTDWIWIQWGPSICIRIRIRNPDPYPGGQKWPTNIEKLLNFIFEILDVLFWGLKASPVAWT